MQRRHVTDNFGWEINIFPSAPTLSIAADHSNHWDYFSIIIACLFGEYIALRILVQAPRFYFCMSSPKDEGPEGQQALKALMSPSLLHDNADPSIINNNEQEHQEHKVTTNSNPCDWHLEGVGGRVGGSCSPSHEYILCPSQVRMASQEELHICPPDKRGLWQASCVLQISLWRWWLQVEFFDWQHSCIRVGKKYHAVTVGEESSVLVLWPDEEKNQGILHLCAMRLEDLQKPTYAMRHFANLFKIYQDDHCKGKIPFSIVQGIGMVTSLERSARCSWMSALIASRS